MNYNFGPLGIQDITSEEAQRLKKEYGVFKKVERNGSMVSVRCPHCGSKNRHKWDGTETHKECDRTVRIAPSKMLKMLKDQYVTNYYCPGYTIKRIGPTLVPRRNGPYSP